MKQYHLGILPSFYKHYWGMCYFVLYILAIVRLPFEFIKVGAMGPDQDYFVFIRWKWYLVIYSKCFLKKIEESYLTFEQGMIVTFEYLFLFCFVASKSWYQSVKFHLWYHRKVSFSIIKLKGYIIRWNFFHNLDFIKIYQGIIALWQLLLMLRV